MVRAGECNIDRSPMFKVPDSAKLGETVILELEPKVAVPPAKGEVILFRVTTPPIFKVPEFIVITGIVLAKVLEEAVKEPPPRVIEGLPLRVRFPLSIIVPPVLTVIVEEFKVEPPPNIIVPPESTIKPEGTVILELVPKVTDPVVKEKLAFVTVPPIFKVPEFMVITGIVLLGLLAEEVSKVPPFIVIDGLLLKVVTPVTEIVPLVPTLMTGILKVAAPVIFTVFVPVVSKVKDGISIVPFPLI